MYGHDHIKVADFSAINILIQKNDSFNTSQIRGIIFTKYQKKRPNIRDYELFNLQYNMGH